MPDDRIYRVHVNGEPVEGIGPYDDEDALIEALLEVNRQPRFDGTPVVHVYKTDATPLGIGRKYLGAIDGDTVLMMGEVDEERVRNR